jgi:S1-C subfamily serine protease
MGVYAPAVSIFQVQMRLFLRRLLSSVKHGAAYCFTLGLLGGCVGPQTIGASQNAAVPNPNSLGKGSVFPRVTPGINAEPEGPPAPPPLFPDTVAEGAPWSGFQLGTEPSRRGVLVGTVNRGSPAALAGIEPGDFIFQLEGHAVSDAQEILAAVDQAGIGGSLRVGVHRGARTRLFRVEPVARPPHEEASEHAKLDSDL